MIRENWRLIALVVLIVASVAVVFVPGTVGGGASDGATNLQYGLQLSGGTQLRTTVVGVMATGVDVGVDNETAIEGEVAGQLQNVTSSDVTARAGSNTVEVFADIEPDALGAALEDADIPYDDVRDGVSEETRTTMVETISSKINTAGLSGGEVQTVTSGGETYITISVPNANRTEVESLIDERGQVIVYALFPENEGPNATYRKYPLFAGSGGDAGYQKPVGAPQQTADGPAVPLTLQGETARNFSNAMSTFGFVDAAIQAGELQPTCTYRQNPDDAGYCLVTELDGEVVYTAGMSPGLARDIQNGVFVNSPSFVITANNFSQARELQINLQAGALPAPLQTEDSFFIGPSFAEQTRGQSVITGLIAVLAVSLVVYLRYGAIKVAAPMVVTALSEVVILLGFIAAVGLPLDLSHIAGLIAVIGTGVDDLVIIADEVMTEQVSSARVFQSRFRKALWVIGAAAVTTIIAMSPLAVLSLGDLTGFAIVTILGVLVGVIITRPAYGDILRRLLTTR